MQKTEREISRQRNRQTERQIGRKTDIQTERQKDIDASVHSYIPPFSGRLHYFFSFHTIADFVL